MSWDQPVANQDKARELCTRLITAAEDTEINFPRSLMETEKSKLKRLAIFVDAASEALQVVAYAITEDEAQGLTIKSQLLMAKSRVHSQTIPEAELGALTAGHRVARIIINAIPKQWLTELTCIDFFSDSNVTLDRIQPLSRPQGVYVANRVQEIRKKAQEFGIECRYYHVPGPENVSDEGTRGNTDIAFLYTSLWQHGPKWLTHIEDSPASLRLIMNEGIIIFSCSTEEIKNNASTAISNQKAFWTLRSGKQPRAQIRNVGHSPYQQQHTNIPNLTPEAQPFNDEVTPDAISTETITGLSDQQPVRELSPGPSLPEPIALDMNSPVDPPVDPPVDVQTDIDPKTINDILSRSSSIRKALGVVQLLIKVKHAKSFMRSKQSENMPQREILMKCIKAEQAVWVKSPTLYTKQLVCFKDPETGVIVTRHRYSHGQMATVFGHAELPVIRTQDRLAHLLCKNGHIQEGIHLSSLATASNTRTGDLAVWIPNLRRKVKSLVSQCVVCRRIRAEPREAQMAPHPTAGMMAFPAYSHLQIDYAGPFWAKPAKHKNTRASQPVKIWALLIVDTITKNTNILAVEDYSSTAFGTAFHVHVSRHGIPATITSDPMSGFIGSAGEDDTEESPLTGCKAMVSKRYPSIQWKFIQPGAQFKQGLIERRVGTLKRLMKSVYQKAPCMTIMQWMSLFATIANIINSTPLFCQPTTEGAFTIITPNHLCLGRSGAKDPPLGYLPGHDSTPLDQLEAVQATTHAFWKAYSDFLCSSAHFTYKKWYGTGPDQIPPRPGDIILICYKNPIKDGFKIAKIEEVSADNRTLDVIVAPISKVGTQGWKAPQKMQVPIQRTVLLLSIQDQ